MTDLPPGPDEIGRDAPRRTPRRTPRVEPDVFVDDDGHEYVALKPHRERPRWALVLGALVLTGLVVLGAGWYWYQQQLDPSGAPGETISVVVPGGSSLGDIAKILDSAGNVPNCTVLDL